MATVAGTEVEMTEEGASSVEEESLGSFLTIGSLNLGNAKSVSYKVKDNICIRWMIAGDAMVV